MVPEKIPLNGAETFKEMCERFFGRFAFARDYIAEMRPGNTASMNVELILKKLWQEGLLENDAFDELLRDAVMLDYSFAGNLREMAEAVFLKIMYDDYWAMDMLSAAEKEMLSDASKIINNGE